jgi:hypothetical protein
MAADGDGFDREDIYTLFITTRIINFFKELPLAAPATFEELLAREWREPRRSIGFESLRRLAETQRLWFSTKDGWRENMKFRPRLCGEALKAAGHVTTYGGNRIDVSSLAGMLALRQDMDIAAVSL